ncbi:hypothetical protein [Roseiconus nitratireducens]|uniref:hypothetical protein n=1 Tax=Roseiconus nitratireducens TaxID=2605748 RepID=UPI001375D614|nr:hypothetical protein [Roseiconus nitratireducens]
MTKARNQTARKPATKYAHLRKKMQQRKSRPGQQLGQASSRQLRKRAGKKK